MACKDLQDVAKQSVKNTNIHTKLGQQTKWDVRMLWLDKGSMNED